ncbi:MAG: hypothetical protein KF752_11010 [Pirellulaceae bacterium]|nr:hypothetical protein [Pirellulaceae bacterium]
MIAPIERFHQQLEALQLAGFPIEELLLNPVMHNSVSLTPESDISDPQAGTTILANESVHSFRQRLQVIVKRVLADAQRGLTPDASLASLPALRPLYFDIWRRWISGGQSIESLELLIAYTKLKRTSTASLELSYFYTTIYCLLGCVCWGVVASVSIPRMQRLAQQADVQPDGIMRLLFVVGSHPWWLIAVLLVLAGLFAWRMQRSQSVATRTKLTACTSQALDRARLARLLAWDAELEQVQQRQQIDSSTSAPSANTVDATDAPLLDWSQQYSAMTADSSVFRWTEQLYGWIGARANLKSANRLPFAVHLVVGGGMALIAGLMLFQPLAATLQMLIDGYGSGR